MESGPFEDVFAIENGDIPASYVSLPEGTTKETTSRSAAPQGLRKSLVPGQYALGW